MDMLIDTDPAMGTRGADPEDGFALLLALRSPEVDVKAVTVVHGNVSLAHGYANATYLLKLLGRTDVAVAPGMAKPLLPHRAHPDNRELGQFAPWTDLETAGTHGVDLIIETAQRSKDGLTIVAIGPLTNIAAAVSRYPRLAQEVRGLVIMGGAATVQGNITPEAEFNIWADPEAASIVFNAGFNLTMVGLDVCNKTRLRTEALHDLDDGSPLGHLVKESARDWFGLRQTYFGGEAFHLYDSLSVAVAFRPELVETVRCCVEIELEGRLTSGATVAYLQAETKRWVGDRQNCALCLDVDAEAFERLFVERVIDPMHRRAHARVDG